VLRYVLARAPVELAGLSRVSVDPAASQWRSQTPPNGHGCVRNPE